jgi:hypothetical protein
MLQEYIDSLYQVGKAAFCDYFNRAPTYAPIVSGKTIGFPRNKKWRIIINTEIESDI